MGRLKILAPERSGNGKYRGKMGMVPIYLCL
jgi:hypothetical protein